ncbi:MAG TPA: very short patch repair endonuclease [Deltaproteobacteria bacterium]|nr:very short patch repair endonuclease [Deltaproteobacteria bacterium]
MDRIGPQARSALMSKVRGKDTGPEMIVRRLLHRLGYRYRLHVRELPGQPDLVFPSRQKAIFIHGCWWHQHRCKRGNRRPATRREYWLPKLEANKRRDAETRSKLRRMGWRTLVIWECQTRDSDMVRSLAQKFLEG